MSNFLTRPNLAQFQPQATQLPFSQFGGPRAQIQGDTTGGLAFPNAGQNPFALPTGLSPTEIQALSQSQLNAFTQQQESQQPGLNLSPASNQFPLGIRNGLNPDLNAGSRGQFLQGALNASNALQFGSRLGSPSISSSGEFIQGSVNPGGSVL